MELELKNIKMHKGHDDSHSYSASLYIDGKPVAICENDGWGGEDCYSAMAKSGLTQQEAEAKIQEVNEWFKTQDPIDTYGDGTPMYNDVEIWCSDQIERFLEDRYWRTVLRRHLKKYARLQDGKLMLSKCNWDPTRLGEYKAHFKGGILLNELPFNEALAILKKTCS